MLDSGAKRLVVLLIPLLVSSCASCGEERGGPSDRSDAGAEEAGDAAVGPEASTNRPPEVAISAPAQVQRGETIAFDASGSTDPDGDALSYEWSLESAPSSSESTLQNAESATAKVRAQSSGTYSAEVVVSDGTASASDTVDVSVINRAPEAKAAASSDAEVLVGTAVNLAASGSTDPEGNPLSYQWSFVTKPSGSSASIEGAEAAMTTVTPDVAGDYTLEVRVSDGEKSDTDRVTVSASASSPETTVYVRTSGADSNPGTKDAPVATLQKGLQIASGDADVERVDLGASTFDASPSFEISKSLTLLGKGVDATVLDAGNSRGFQLRSGGQLRLIDLATVDATPAVEVPDGARVDANSWQCQGAGACVDTSGTAVEPAVSLTDSTLDGDGGVLALQMEAKSLQATNVTIRDFTVGIATSDGDVRIDKSTIENCQYAISQGASTSASLQVLETSMVDNEIGVQTDGAKSVTVANSTFRNHSKYGLRFESGGSATLRETEIQKSGRSGVRVSGDVVVTLDGGAFFDNGRGNPANDRDRAGIYFEGSSHLFDAKGKTEIYGHPKHNVVFVGQSGGTLLEMFVHDAANAGVYANTGGTVELEDGRYVENENGVYAEGPSTVLVRRSDFIRNSKSGIDYRGTGKLKARGLVLKKNARYQVRISNSPGTVDLGRESDAGGNLFEMASTSRFAIYDARPALGAATGTLIHAADNLYSNGNYSIWFYNTSSLDAETFTGPATWKNTSAGDEKAVFKIEHQNQRIAF